MRVENPAVAVGGLLLNSTVWGLSWWVFRHLQGLGLTPLWSTALMYVLGSVVIALWRPDAMRALVRHPQLLGVALAAGATNAAFNWGVTEGEVMRVVLLFYLMPVWSALLARVVLRERLNARVLVRLALALVGAVIVLLPAGGGLPLPSSFGDWLGLVGGMFFALNNVLLRKFSYTPPQARGLAMFIGGAAVSSVVATLLAGAGVAPPLVLNWQAWALPVAAMAFAFLAANFGLQFGAARLPANVTSVVMTIEIVVAGGSAVLLGGELLTGRLLLGGGLIVAAVLLAAWRRRSVPA